MTKSTSSTTLVGVCTGASWNAPRKWLTGCLALVALALTLAIPASANAAFGIPTFNVAPSSTSASQTSDLSLTFSRSGTASEDLKSTAVSLPNGLTYSIAGAPKCSTTDFGRDRCSSATIVGTASARAAAATILGSIDLTGAGTIYALSSGELGVIFRSTVFSDSSFKQTIDISPLTGGPRITATSYPTRVYFLGLLPIDITISEVGYRLQGRSGSGNNGAVIIVNPAACGTAESRLVATSTQGVSVTKSSTFAVTDCGGATAPTVSFTSPASGSTTTTTASSISASFTAAGTPTPTCTISGSTVTTPATVNLAVGSNTVTITCSSSAGSASDTITVIRNQAPAISSLASSAGTTTTASSTNLTWSTTGYPVPTCTVNGSSATSGVSVSLVNGPNTFNVVCSNGVSPNATASITVTKNQAPGISAYASSAGTTTTASSTNLTWSTTGYPAPTCTVNGSSATSGVNVSLVNGANTFALSCSNGVGSAATDSITVTKNQAPAISALASSAGTSTTATNTNLTWSTTGYPAPTCTVNGNAASSGVNVSLVVGDNTFSVVCSNGISPNATASITVTRTALGSVPDTTITQYGQPSMGVPASGPTRSSISFQFSGTESPTSYQCAVAPAPDGADSYTALVGNFDSLTWSACSTGSSNTVASAGLSSPAQYMYLVRAVNGTGTDQTPAKGFFWNDNRTFTANPGPVEYYTNSLVTDQDATNDAGAHPTLGTTLDVEGFDDGKTVDLVMPDGLMGSLAAIDPADRCDYSQFISLETCPLTSKLGTLSGSAIGSVDGEVSAEGNLYLIEPDSLGSVLPGAAAAVALVIDDIDAPITTNPGKILAIGGLYINDNGFNIRVSIDEIPNQTTENLRFHATTVSLKLDGDTRPDMGQPASATNPALITNPHQCAVEFDGDGEFYGVLEYGGADRPNWDKFYGSGTGYEGSVTPVITVDYPVDNCESATFDPSIDFTTDPTPLKASTSTVTEDLAITSTVNFNYEDSTLMSTKIYMPPYISTNTAGLGAPEDQCANATIVAGDNGVVTFDPTQDRGCPAQARVGTASLTSPMIEGTINADVWLIEASPIPSLGITVRDTTPGNPRGVNVGIVIQTGTPANEYPTADLLAPWGLSGCTVTSNTATNNRRVNKCRTSVSATVSPGMVPDLPMSSLTLTIGNVGGRLDTNSNPLARPLRAATNSDTLACRVGGGGGSTDWLPPTGSSVTPASSAFRMAAASQMVSWGFDAAPEQHTVLSMPLGGTGCLQ